MQPTPITIESLKKFDWFYLKDDGIYCVRELGDNCNHFKRYKLAVEAADDDTDPEHIMTPEDYIKYETRTITLKELGTRFSGYILY